MGSDRENLDIKISEFRQAVNRAHTNDERLVLRAELNRLEQQEKDLKLREYLDRVTVDPILALTDEEVIAEAELEAKELADMIEPDFVVTTNDETKRAEHLAKPLSPPESIKLVAKQLDKQKDVKLESMSFVARRRLLFSEKVSRFMNRRF